jgi:hypothetical protein
VDRVVTDPARVPIRAAFAELQREYALLGGDKSILLVSITAPDRGGVEKVVQVPPELSPQARQAREGLRRVLKEQNLLDKRDVSVAILAELARQLPSGTDKPSS